MDLVISGCSTLAETIVLLLGPLLILFASTIIIGLSWVFFTIYLPMMQFALDQQEASSLRRVIEIGANVGFVVFILVEIIFNYFMCVTTRNSGPFSSFDTVVRELAESTAFEYPNTPKEVARFRRNLDEKLMQRMREYQTRDADERERMRAHSRCCDANGKCSGKSKSKSNSSALLSLSNPTNTLGTGATMGSTGQDANLLPLDQVPPGSGNSNGNGNSDVTLRKTTRQQQSKANSNNNSNNNNNNNNNSNNNSNNNMAPGRPIRMWMLLGPDEWGYCTKTKQPKPPRSHYDHVSKSLVLCLDHYCPWMFNAIGYFNYRYFVNFLIFVFTGMMYGAFISYRPFANSTGKEYREQFAHYRKTGVWEHMHPYTPIGSERMPLSVGFMLCLAVGAAVAFLGGFHIHLLLSGQTTIEFHGNFVNRRKAKRLGQKYRNPYDMGWRRNWQQVYGDYNDTKSVLMAILVPSRREPHFLPIPIGVEQGKRKHLRNRDGKYDGKGDDDDEEEEGAEMTKPMLGSLSVSSAPVNIV